MKVSVQWLREWVDVDADVGALAHSLTMAGLEIEGNFPAAPEMSGVIVADVMSVERHPDAEKLSVCRVSTGRETLQIVCGAPNVRAGMKAPLATVGAKLPGGMDIKQATLRGVDSFGMLCSARELGLSDDSSGLLELPGELTAGADLFKALALDDRILEVNVTPNRGDCMSIAGVAREVAANTGKTLHAPAIKAVAKQSDAAFPVKIEASRACTKFASRLIRGVRPNQPSPFWMRERLRRAGLRPISLLVDVTNYVVLELGQPMHAYDRNNLAGGLTVRHAKEAEKLKLLDGRVIELASDILVIADDKGPVGMAGVMGGEVSGIVDATTDLFLEAAHFTPDAVAGRGRRFGIITDASQRFERGVDPELPERAIERATQLILENAGGTAGPTVLTRAQAEPKPAAIRVRHARIGRVLGIDLDAKSIGNYLGKLGMQVTASKDGWQVTAPSWRFDIKIEEDLIEEIARLHGYNNIPPVEAPVVQHLGQATEGVVPRERAADVLIDRGYQEAIAYSFVDPSWQALMFPGEATRALVNPISAELGVMRLSLWPGLAIAARENLRRQQSRVRIFETGRKFVGNDEIEVIAGLAVGGALPEQWDAPNRKIDFFDIKADVEALLALTGESDKFIFKAARHSALHPGQCAQILRGSENVGMLGALHPDVAKKMDLTYPSFAFELDFRRAFAARLPQFTDISRFPAIRRDLAVIVAEAVTLDALAAQVRAAAGLLLRDLSVLSVYRGEQIEKGKKSIALSLNLQDTSRTLTDEDADRVIAQVVENLRARLGASIRDK
jgi:phenylalanyl-tRNA synthetase beta chain